MKIEELPKGVKPSQVLPRASADDIHTRNIRAVVEVVRAMRDDMEQIKRDHAILSQSNTELRKEVEELKIKMILLQHQGSGATAS